MKRIIFNGLLFCFLITAVACSQGSRIFFTGPEDGATVDSPFLVTWSAENFVIEPGGEDRPGAGHAHIVINNDCITPGRPVPANNEHIHYADGQLETTLDLYPGTYTLCLVAGNGIHVALDGNGMQDTMTVEVANYTAPRIRFTEPVFGATIEGAVQVIAQVENVEAADGLHLAIVVNNECIDGEDQIPSDESHIHLDEGQTEIELDLEEGAYTLCLQLADENDVALDNRGASDEINIIVR